MRYFFHLKRAGEVFSDCSGEDFDDAKQAHAYGVRMARALLRHLPELRSEPGWYIAIAREARPVVSIMLASVEADAMMRPVTRDRFGLRPAANAPTPFHFDLFGYDWHGRGQRRGPRHP